MARRIEGPNEAFVIRLAEATEAERLRIASHALYVMMEQRALPLRAIHGYLGEMVPWFRGTMDRAIVRALKSPYGPIKHTWLVWASEEFGHAEMLLDVIRLTGGDPAAWGSHSPIYESEALISYMWKLAHLGTYLENAAGAFLGTEGLLRHTLAKFGRLLREQYYAPEEAMKVFGEHEAGDSDHFQHGLYIIAAADKLGVAEERAVESAVRTTLLFHSRWHDGILAAYGA